MTEEERARRRDDFLATLYAASETPELIPTLADEYITEHGYPMVVGETIRVEKSCPLPHVDISKEERARRIRAFFWVQFWWSFILSYIALLSIAMVSYSNWEGDDPMIEWGSVLLYGIVCFVGSVVWAKFAIWWKKSNYDL